MRKFVFAIGLLIGIVFIFLNIAEVQDIVDTLQRGDIRFILLAFCIQAIWLVNVAASYRYVYRALNIDETVGRLLLMSAAATFVNVVAPSAGVGGVAVFISEARRRGNSSARVTVAGVLVILFDYLGFLCVLALGIIVLVRRNNLHTSELIASSILLLIAVIWTTFLYLGMRSADSLGRVLAAIARFMNRVSSPLIKREYLSEERAYEFAHDASEGLFLLRQKPINLIVPAILGLTSKLLLVFILFLLFLAFDVPFSPGTLVAGFSIGYLFWIVSGNRFC
jgi:uncharacterized protein (TIRG00374 family)